MSSNNPNRVYLDTETTGLHPEEGDEILSLTIVDANGRLLFDERFKPKYKKEWPEAQAVNHISPDDVEHLTTIDAYMEQICRILDRIADEIVGYNVAFDIGFLKAAGATINPDAVLARAANEEKILYIDSEKYEQMEKELPRYGGTRFPPALAALSMDIIIPSSYICKMKAEINPKLSDREREHNSLNRTMHIKVADSRRNRLAQDRDKPRNITPRYDDDNRDSQ